MHIITTIVNKPDWKFNAEVKAGCGKMVIKLTYYREQIVQFIIPFTIIITYNVDGYRYRVRRRCFAG